MIIMFCHSYHKEVLEDQDDVRGGLVDSRHQHASLRGGKVEDRRQRVYEAM